MKTNPPSTPIADIGVSALRGLSSAGYFTPEQLAAMESVLRGQKESQPSGKQWLIIGEAGKYSKLSRTTLWKYNQTGRLAIHKIGRRCLIERNELDTFLLEGQGSAWAPNNEGDTKMPRSG
jgi:excisionase family DNA binding protein